MISKHFSIVLGIEVLCPVSGTAYVEPFEVIEYADGLSKSKKAHHGTIQFGANGQKTVILGFESVVCCSLCFW